MTHVLGVAHVPAWRFLWAAGTCLLEELGAGTAPLTGGLGTRRGTGLRAHCSAGAPDPRGVHEYYLSGVARAAAAAFVRCLGSCANCTTAVHRSTASALPPPADRGADHGGHACQKRQAYEQKWGRVLRPLFLLQRRAEQPGVRTSMEMAWLAAQTVRHLPGRRSGWRSGEKA